MEYDRSIVPRPGGLTRVMKGITTIPRVHTCERAFCEMKENVTDQILVFSLFQEASEALLAPKSHPRGVAANNLEIKDRELPALKSAYRLSKKTV